MSCKWGVIGGGKILKQLCNMINTHLRSRQEKVSSASNHVVLEDLSRKLDWALWQIDMLSMALDPYESKARSQLLKLLVPNIPVTLEFRRIGRDGDGGYLVAIPLQKRATVITAGLADDVSFEIEISKMVDRVISLDHTIPQLETPSLNFSHVRKALKSCSSESAVSVEELVNLYPAEDYLLKIDIEGDEWEIFSKVDVEILSKFSQIIVEFHGFVDQILPEKFEQMNSALLNLHTTHYVAQSHANNFGIYRFFGQRKIPDVVEVTFINKNHVDKLGLEKNKTITKSQQNSPLRRPIDDDWHLSF